MPENCGTNRGRVTHLFSIVDRREQDDVVGRAIRPHEARHQEEEEERRSGELGRKKIVVGQIAKSRGGREK